jgi:hypothetical protein
MRRFRHGYDIKKDLNYLSVRLSIPTDIDNKPIIDAFSIFLDLVVKGYKLEKYNKKSKYDKY